MKDEADSHDLTSFSDIIGVTSDSGMTRWAPLVVVLGVVGGFMALSWYAYHAGIQSVKEEDLVVVEADKTPIKEKPADPGGMQFPNQDKTVFETFSSNQQQPAKVERVLPVPEEPMPKDTDASETTTWVNKELPKKSTTEQVIGKEPAKKADEPVHMAAAATDEKSTFSSEAKPQNPAGDHQAMITKAASDDEQSVTYIAPKKPAVAEKRVKVADNSHAQPFAPEKAKENDSEKAAAISSSAADEDASGDVPIKEAAPEKPAKKAVASETRHVSIETHTPRAGSNAMAQLGAYRSQEEAEAAWGKMHLKQKLLSDKQPTVLRVDLGDKGIYYRLRVGLASEAEAKSLCHALSSAGQACIIPTSK